MSLLWRIIIRRKILLKTVINYNYRKRPTNKQTDRQTDETDSRDKMADRKCKWPPRAIHQGCYACTPTIKVPDNREVRDNKRRDFRCSKSATNQTWGRANEVSDIPREVTDNWGHAILSWAIPSNGQAPGRETPFSGDDWVQTVTARNSLSS